MTRLPGAPLVAPRGAPRGDRRGSADGSAAVPPPDAPRVGVLALQGDVLEHVRALTAAGAAAVPVRDAAALAAVNGLVLPGGESTTISRLLVLADLLEPLRARIAAGMPVLGTCAGLILLSDELTAPDDGLPRPGGLAVRTRRNAYGRQVDSFDARVEVAGVAGGPVDAAFIRAPLIEGVLDTAAVEVLAEVDGVPVAVRQGAVLGLSFHPEVAGDHRVHALLVAAVRDAVGRDADRP
ncbi:MAG: pyridoxal 5'-phosphate synthase glutaminase subunit PdxT [Nitriliruptoraceae bacterium]